VHLLLAATTPASAETTTLVQVFIPVAIATIMFAMGLGLRTIDFRRVALEPRAVLIGAFAQLVLLPVVGFALATLFELPPPLAVGFMLITAAPGGPSSNIYSHLARGDVALSVTLTAVSGVVTIITIPLIMHLVLGHFLGESRTVSLPVGETILQIALIVGLPLGLGMFLRHHRPAAADKADRIFKRVAVGLLVVFVVGAVTKEARRIGGYVDTLLLPVVVLSFGTMFLGLALAVLGRLPIRQGVTICIEVGMQNGALAMGLALGAFGSEEIAMPAVIYSLVAYFSCAIWIPIGRRFVPHRAPPAA
jgi:BASS family bile acid:Na+ symporter